MREFANAKTLFRIVKEIVYPILLSEGFSPIRGTRGCWRTPLNNGAVSVCVHLSSLGSSAGGGNTFDVEFTLTNKEGFVVRKSYLTRCLVQNQLNDLMAIQSAVNARRPRSAETEVAMNFPGPVGDFVRARYSVPSESRYREGSYVEFDYYSEDDVRAFSEFTSHCVSSAIARFVSGGCPAPITEPVRDTFSVVKTVL